MKKIVLTLLLILAVIPGINAQSTINVGNLSYRVDYGNQYLYLSGCNEPVANLVIPETVTYDGEEYTVVGIDYNAFSSNPDLASLSIPKTVRSIYTNLENTNLYADESKWTDGALYIDNCLIALKKDFTGTCKIKEGTRVIAANACKGSSASDFEIPESVISIGVDAFTDSKFYNTSSNWSSGMSIYLDNCLLTCQNPSSEYSVKEGTRVIADEAFSYGNAKTCNIPASVRYIGNKAFANSNFADIYFSEGLEYLGEGVFKSCSNLENVVFPQSLQVIESGCFDGCMKLKSVQLPSNLTRISDKMFATAGITSYEFPEGITRLGREIFSFCTNLTSVTIPASVNTICGSFSLAVSVKTINNKALTPQTLKEDDFLAVKLENLTLNVEESALEAYKKANIWKNFGNIGILSSIKSVSVLDGISFSAGLLHNINGKYISIYNSNGSLVYTGNGKCVTLSSGIYIVVYGNRSMKIVL